jgi:cytoskeletal protein CcmA (bactofilin family)
LLTVNGLEVMDPNSTTPPAEPPAPSNAPEPAETEDGEDALEQQEVPAEGAASTRTSDVASATVAAPLPKKPGGLKARMKRFNLYLLLFTLILLIAAGVVMISFLQSTKTTTTTINSQKLTQSDLSQLANSDASVGDPKQILNIESNAVFAGQVLVREGLEVADNLQVGGTTSLQSLTASGQSTLSQVQISKDLTVAGTAAVQGQETVGQSLQVSGTGTFGGALSAPQITTSSLQLNSDLTLQHHLVAGGPTPSHQSGSALGSGGTTSLSGSDTAGTVAINTGSGAAAGCFIAISFATAYASVPSIVLTPVGSSAGGISYYVNQTTLGFSICDASAPPSGASFGFNYFVAG